MRFFIFIILILFLSLSFALSARAAEISFDAKTREITIGQQFQVDVLLNTENEEINALEGEITFGSDALELKEIRDGNSFINFWVERPRVEQNSKIIFSGITPGGYKSDKGLIFSIIFQAKKQGVGAINLESARALKNDGQGTNASLKIFNFQFSISNPPAGGPNSQIPIPEIKDTEPPESFVPEIANSPALFEGKQILVFATQDKKSGIDHYEVKETRQRIFTIFSEWISAKSPYVLEDQELRSYVFVKAIDKAGNIRVEKIQPKNPLAWYENYENWIIIILAVFLFILWKYLWSRKLKY